MSLGQTPGFVKASSLWEYFLFCRRVFCNAAIPVTLVWLTGLTLFSAHTVRKPTMMTPLLRSMWLNFWPFPSIWLNFTLHIELCNSVTYSEIRQQHFYNSACVCSCSRILPITSGNVWGSCTVRKNSAKIEISTNIYSWGGVKAIYC